MQRKHLPLDPRRGARRWSDGRKLKWFLDERFSPRLLRSIELEMREKQFYNGLHLMLLGVEILSGFLAGREPNVETFCSFMKRYFNRQLSSGARPPRHRRGVVDRGPAPRSIAEVIWWAFRCGLKDSGVVYPGGSLAERSRYYCRCYRRVGLRLDVHKFYRDFLRAYQSYSSDAYGDYLVRQRFVKRFDQLFGAAPPRGAH